MSAPLLPDYAWQISYGPSDDRLHDFYIPVLQRSVRYDRSAGFFRSSALAVAAAGVADLITHGGTMRLLVGAHLSPKDVEAIKRGSSLVDVVTEKLIAELQKPLEDLKRRRFEILAWMVADGTLEIKVVLPQGADGLPIADSLDYYHPKEGLFTDADGNQIAFSGSVNESETGWQRNYELFSVYFSWDETLPYLRQVEHRFEALWNGREKDWIALDVPDAVRQALVRYAPDERPAYDPLAAPVELPPPTDEKQLQRERIIFQFLRDVPHLPDSSELGAATCTITPWPHQAKVAQQIIETFPQRYMLCDEVGLGKTIEAGLVLRQLVLSGYIQRCLLLVPKSVARQWQEELYEKFVLDVPLFDGHRFWNYAGEEVQPENGTRNLWDAFDMFIASSQLAKRRDRHEEVTSARPWDLVLVDEAHHARRRDFQQRIYRPNRLLDLLTDPAFKAQAVLLVTATPMQVHPLEVWDLLKVLGIGGMWGADEENFLKFYWQLMASFEDVDWDFVFSMVRDFLDRGGSLYREFADTAQKELGLVDWTTIRSLPYEDRPSRKVKGLSPKARPYVVEMARRHTPLMHYMFRNTRDLLREYQQRGLLDETVPFRDPQLVWIPMRDEEEDLYLRIEDYISNFYRKYEAERRGLGFVMTVYRRRLTSSFYAVRESLERRLAYLRGLGDQGGLVDDDLEQDDLSRDISEMLEEEDRSLYKDEIDYVENFLYELQQLSAHDSKTEQLLADLDTIFKHRDTVVIFTLYTDTMDYLRDKLVAVYGSQVGCYSGRGGEVWNGMSWVTVSKEAIKQAFRKGEEVKILVCTEAASEGLNLQTCGVLINYDMPWNPMRVEQRIGRIDRIGQRHDTVWVRNYFYENTIEARVYQALALRINWFEGVVGDLQPILAQVGRVIERLVMTVREEREEVLQEELAEINKSLDQRDADILAVYETTERPHPWAGLATPLTLKELEVALTASEYLKSRFQSHPQITDAYVLQADDSQVEVTFNPDVFDDFPNSLEFLSYGSSVLDSLLNEVDPPDIDESGVLLRLAAYEPVPLVAYYALSADHAPVRLRTLAELTGLAADPDSHANWTENTRLQAQADFEDMRTSIHERLADIARLRRDNARAALIERARQILLRAALIELALGQRPDMFEAATYPTAFNEQAVRGLARHGYPFGALLEITEYQVPVPQEDDPEYQDLVCVAPDRLKRRFSDLESSGKRLLEELPALQGDPDGSSEVPAEVEASHFQP